MSKNLYQIADEYVDNVMECTCDLGMDHNCWYRLSEREKLAEAFLAGITKGKQISEKPSDEYR